MCMLAYLYSECMTNYKHESSFCALSETLLLIGQK